MQEIKVHPISPAVGAEISGVDLSQPLNPDTVSRIRQVLLAQGVVFFRDQKLTADQLLTAAGYFGKPVEYPFVRGLDDCPLVIPVLKLPNETLNFGGVWHSDTTYLVKPPMATMLHARDLPELGGDTLFANMTAAYDALSDAMKVLLAPLKALNSAANQTVADTRKHRLEDSGKDTHDVQTEAIHPVVRVHPETGRKSLYVNSAHTVRLEGMTDEESASILQFLYTHQVREEFSCRFRWSPGALAFWDNRCTQHYPVNDYHGFRRLLYRVTLAGDVPN